MDMYRVWEEIAHICKWEEDEDIERLIVEEYLKELSAILTEMACVRSINMSVEKGLPFPFYLSSKEDVFGRHDIRMKVQWNPTRITSRDADGYFELHGNYDYVPGSHKYIPTSKELKVARDFIKKYKVLFAAAWEGKVLTEDVADWFEGKIQLNELLSRFENVSEIDYYNINHCKSIPELEEVVRKYKIFNMND